MTFRAVRSKDPTSSLAASNGMAALCVLIGGKAPFRGVHPMHNATGPFSNHCRESSDNTEYRNNARLEDYRDFFYPSHSPESESPPTPTKGAACVWTRFGGTWTNAQGEDSPPSEDCKLTEAYQKGQSPFGLGDKESFRIQPSQAATF
eukprot:Protomagalhaensia_sp_Gyna_25__1169@NODE_1576_length_1717_cov_1413_848629_g1283_i0_p1_GENE_NODE_1576_length_1717_cov_1413_848629_g1283_i0NODE_1576_length_1717_cov_1413_848629_g1283_i0_p1_ORF_typecomplete_len148_score9_24UCMA/PF17085_5/0_25_NODE_1576_length_1717_cov_1413_848629_g1283_i0260703